MRHLVLAGFALTMLTACQPATTELTEEQKAEMAAEVELLHGQYWDAWRVADVARGMSYYNDSPNFVLALDGQLINGFAAFDDLASFVFANVASQAVTVDETHTTVVAQDVVCVVEHITYTQTDTSGAEGPTYTAAITSLWVRRDAEWKIHHFHNSSPTPEQP